MSNSTQYPVGSPNPGTRWTAALDPPALRDPLIPARFPRKPESRVRMSRRS